MRVSIAARKRSLEPATRSRWRAVDVGLIKHPTGFGTEKYPARRHLAELELDDSATAMSNEQTD